MDDARLERECDSCDGEPAAARGGHTSDVLCLVISDERDTFGGSALARGDALSEHPLCAGRDANVTAEVCVYVRWLPAVHRNEETSKPSD